MNARQIIDAALAAFASDGDDDQVVDAMAAAGVDRDLAAEALVFVPLAFGRAAFSGAGPEFPASYSAAGVERDLADHPLYLEALAAAGRCDRRLFRDVVLRSSETAALNSAAHAGSKLEDLIVSPPVLSTDPARGRAELETALRLHLDPESRRAARMTREVFEAHGPESGAAEVTARVYSGSVRPGFVTLQLDVELAHPDLGDRRVLESSGGVGDGTAAALGNAFEKFCRGALHPILGGVIDASLGGDQVEVCERDGWRLTLGPLLHQWKVPDGVDYWKLFDALIDRLLASGPAREIHWLRVYYMQGPDGPFGYDVLLDNEVWDDGVALVTGWPWPFEGDAYGVRHFAVLAPA